jgi:hypothetical protein
MHNPKESNMKKSILRMVGLGLISGLGLLVAGANPAAADGPSASGSGAGSGNAVVAGLDVPVLVCGNGVAGSAGGVAKASGDCPDSSSTSAAPMGTPTASGDGVVTGNLAYLVGKASGTLCGQGVAAAILGKATADDLAC